MLLPAAPDITVGGYFYTKKEEPSGTNRLTLLRVVDDYSHFSLSAIIITHTTGK